MNVLPVPGKHRSTADQAAHDGKSRLQNGQPERNHRNGDGNDGRRLLHALQGQRAQHEIHKQAAAVARQPLPGLVNYHVGSRKPP